MTGAKFDNIKRQIDNLIWLLDNYRPSAGERIPVELTPAELAKMLNKRSPPGVTEFPREVEYRGRVLVAVDGGK